MPGPMPAAEPALPTLTVAISTIGQRGLRIEADALPRQEGVDCLVLVQEPRPDVLRHLETTLGAGASVHPLTSRGVAASRNAALDRARGEIVLIADDDVTHPEGAYAAIRRAFAADPGLDLLAGRSFTPDGAPRKPGQDRAHRLRLWNSGRISSHELAFRRARVAAAGIRFDERFGAGAGTPTFLGEEYVFVADCLKAGLSGRYAPIPVSVHPPESSGFVWRGPAAARARAAVLGRVFGPWAPLMRLAFAAKNLRRFGSARDLGAFLAGR